MTTTRPDLSSLSESERELWAERAAVREHDGRQPRDYAEREALADVLRMRERARPRQRALL